MHPDVLRQQGEDLYNAGRYSEAESVFRACLIAAPRDAGAHYNLGVVLAKQDRYHEAIVCFTAALKHNPDLSLAYTNVGFCLNELGETSMALQAFSLAHQLAPDDPMPELNEGLALLTLGEFGEGWRKFEARWHRKEAKPLMRNFTKPLWRGEDLRGKAILLHAEEGFGDTLQMARYLPLFQERGAKPVFEVQPALVRLLQASLPSGVKILAQGGDPLPDFDYYAPILSVPIGFDTQLSTIPSPISYLKAPQEDKAKWERLLPSQSDHGQKPAKRVGLVWSGRPSHERDRHRSIPLVRLAPLFALPHMTWVNLQYPITQQDLSFFIAQRGFVHEPVLFKDFADTAGLIEHLDLVITVDTSVAHLAGALGKPTWVLLPYVADWRWLQKRTDTPWYPTMRLYRQSRIGDWDSTILNIKQDLQSFPFI